MSDPVFLTRVVLRNYKSIAKCEVALGALTFVVGPNGAGKSNFLDALRLVAESLNASLDHALRERGGINEVRRRSADRPTHFGIRLEFRLPDGHRGVYAFRVGAQKKGGYEVQQEECCVCPSGVGEESRYRVVSGEVIEANGATMPPASRDRLYLVNAAGLPGFRPLFDALSHMGFYNFNPDAIRDLQQPDPGDVLRRDGSNMASVLRLLARENPETRQQVTEFLAKVVPGVTDVTPKNVGKKETLEFRQMVGSSKTPWRFPAENMSDGTLRALGVLTALFQSGSDGATRVPFIGIEEPEAAVHPGAAGVLRDGLRTATATTQVAVTSHSPDLLDDKGIGADCILGVASINGETKIGPVDAVEQSVLRDRLFTAGELLSRGQLAPDIERINRTPATQLELFGETPDAG
jgi:predicted ATPase